MTTPSNPDDIALIQQLYQTVALKNNMIETLHHALSLSKDSEALLQQQLDKHIHTHKMLEQETQIKTTLLKRQIRELQDKYI